MKQTQIGIGDIIEMPLSNGRKVFGQYVFMDKKMGPLVQVFDLITEHPIQLEQLKDAKALFPPVITGLFAAIRTKLWHVIGHLPVEGFVYPKFVSTFYNEKNGKAGVWFMWDGEKSIRIGDKLSPEYKKLEYLVVWDPHDVVHRIETKEYPYPYGDLIQRNAFTPRKQLQATVTR